MIDCELLLCHEYIKKDLLSQAHPLLKKLKHTIKLFRSLSPISKTLYHLRTLLCVFIHEYEKAENTYLKAIKEHAIPSQPLLSPDSTL